MASDVIYRARGDVPNDKVVSSVRVTTAVVHAVLTIWNRGGYAGNLTVDAADAMWFVDVLIPPADRERTP